MSTVRHGHSSSLYSATPKSLAKQVERAIDADDPTANLLTYTEVGSPERTQALEQADPGWGAWVPDQSDVGIMWDKDNFEPKYREPVKLTDKVWTDGQGRKHETWAATMLLRHTDGHRLWVSVCHLPSHVQNGKKFHDNAQARAWRDAVDGWHGYWNDCRKADKPDLGMLVADWNIDFHMQVWRDEVQRIFDSMHLGWKGHMPPAGKGTHGSRLIDATWATTKANKCALLKDDDSSDHRPYGEAHPWQK